MPKPIFYFDKLKTWDKITILLYILLSIFLWFYFENTSDIQIQQNIVFGYAFGTQFFLYLFNYKSLRNLTVYFFWIAIGIVHLFLYYQLKDNPILQNSHEHSVTGLRNTIILLFLFQGLRFISAKMQGQELVSPSKGGTDLFDERQVTFIDFILFIIYIGTTIILLVND